MNFLNKIHQMWTGWQALGWDFVKLQIININDSVSSFSEDLGENIESLLKTLLVWMLKTIIYLLFWWILIPFSVEGWHDDSPDWDKFFIFLVLDFVVFLSMAFATVIAGVTPPFSLMEAFLLFHCSIFAIFIVNMVVAVHLYIQHTIKSWRDEMRGKSY